MHDTQRSFRAALPLVVAVALAAPFAISPARGVEVLVPSYFYPGGANNEWPRLNAAAAEVALTAILNPASGPGTSVDSNYTTAVNSLRSAGGRVISYISTSYTDRPIAQVKADILKYHSLYQTDGYFLDELTNTNGAAEVNYYAEVYSYIKSLNPSYRVVGNPGTNTQESYVTTPTVDTVITFENSSGYAGWTPSPWMSNYATRRFSNIPYAIADEAGMQAAVTAATNKRVGYLYVTDDSGANPWDRLPTYWEAELDTIRAVTPTWASSASGDWNQASRWTTTTIPNGVGAEAMLLGAISTPQTLYSNAPVTLGTLVIGNASRYDITGAGSLTMDASVETALIDIRKGYHTINLPLVLKDTTHVFVQAGATLTIADPLTFHAGTTLVKSGSGTLNVTSIVTQLEAPALSVRGGALILGASAELGSFDVSKGAAVDLGRASLSIVTFDRTAIRAALRDAVDTSNTSGLFSSAGDPSLGLSYAATDGGGEISLALFGDATRDGSVDFDDLLVMARSLHAADRAWTDGDFNYDGVVNPSDLSLAEQNYSDDAHTGSFAGDWELARSIAPEPALASVLVVATLVRARRR